MNLDNINTDVMFQKLLDKMKELDAMRERKEIPGRKDLLDYLILRFRIEAPDNYLITTEQGTDSITITIESTEILCIDEVPTLKQLINIASYFKIYPHDRNVILKLTCPLMEWKEKDHA